MNAIITLSAAVLLLCHTTSTEAQIERKKSRTGNMLFDNTMSHTVKTQGIQSITPPYNFSYYTSTFTNLVGSTSLNNGLTWDDPSFTIPVGFNFILWDDTISSIDIGDLGGWLIPTIVPGTTTPFIMNTLDFCDRASDTVNWEGQPGSLSPISYQTSGMPGSRILKVEWKNVGFYDDISDDNVSTDHMNYQVWLHEGSNNIELIFGPSSISQPGLIYYWGSSGPAVGVGSYDQVADSLYVFGAKGSASAPTAQIYTLDTNWLSVTGTPPSGIVYKYSWFFLSIDETGSQNHLLNIFPNPAGEHATLQWRLPSAPSKAITQITDLSGKTVQHNVVSFDAFGESGLDVSTLAPGVYVLKLTADETTIYKKIIKK